jgi:hypothetical protein
MSDIPNAEKPWDRRVVLGKEPTTSRRSQGWYSRGYLPHFDGPGSVQHITFHLADSLPREAIVRMEQQLADCPYERQAIERRQRIQSLLDSGLYQHAERITHPVIPAKAGISLGAAPHQLLFLHFGIRIMHSMLG